MRILFFPGNILAKCGGEEESGEAKGVWREGTHKARRLEEAEQGGHLSCAELFRDVIHFARAELFRETIQDGCQIEEDGG